jgi:hypothetical protein
MSNQAELASLIFSPLGVHPVDIHAPATPPKAKQPARLPNQNLQNIADESMNLPSDALTD